MLNIVPHKLNKLLINKLLFLYGVCVGVYSGLFWFIFLLELVPASFGNNVLWDI